MTRSSLLRVALGCAGLLGCLVLGAGIHAFGIPNTLRVLAFSVLGGGAASLGWHGIGRLFERPEPRHRASGPDSGIRQRPRPAAAPPPPEGYAPPESWPRSHGLTYAEAEELAVEFAERLAPHLAPPEPPRTREAYVDPYLDRLDEQRPESAPAAGADDDLYAHPGGQGPWA